MASNLPPVAVAMSGGVDSSVAAALLHKAGYPVVGFTMKLWDAVDEDHARKVCCTTVMARDASRVCDILGIPHYTLDLRDDFQRHVIDLFEHEYIAGRTPNPCVQCNSRVKWGRLWEKAQRLGMERIATGHYARIVPDGEAKSESGELSGSAGRVALMRGVDPAKDQSYFLWEIPQSLLVRTLFPLGDLNKAEVRNIARELQLPIADKEESQEVCFVPRDDYRGWLMERRPELAEGSLAGEMVNSSGRVIGEHGGYPFFTIGQRRGLGLGGGRKYYVNRIDPLSRRVHVGSVEELERSELRVGSVNLLNAGILESGGPFSVKIRYRDDGTDATVSRNGSGELLIRTRQPVRAVTPGQSAVIYQRDTVVAGGIILE